MGFKIKSFGTVAYTAKVIEPKKVIILSCEGNNTEPEYFQALKSSLRKNIPVLLEIEIVPKDGSPSQPKFLVDNLDKFLEKYDLHADYDEMWIVLDRETEDARKKQIEEIIPECNEKKYSIAITNPLFEFWLLLHVDDIAKYDRNQLTKNEWVTSAKNRRFIDKKLSEILSGYKKKEGKFPKKIITIDNIQRAIEQEKLFAQEVDEILNNLGSNISTLIQRIVKI